MEVDHVTLDTRPCDFPSGNRSLGMRLDSSSHISIIINAIIALGLKTTALIPILTHRTISTLLIHELSNLIKHVSYLIKHIAK